MSQLLRNASLDERSIEYEMGLAMFGTLDEKESVDYVSRSNSMDAYERMRSDYQHHIGISAFSHDDISVGVI